MAQHPKRVAGRMAPHPQPAPGPTAKPRGRSDTLKAAWIGALAGSVVAAVLTGTITWMTAQRQIQAENELSSTEFLRQEQKAAYATWLAADAKVSQSAHDLARTVKTAVGSGRAVDRQDVLTKARAEMDGLIVASSALYLVGSPGTIETVRRSAKAHIDRHDAIFSLLAMGSSGRATLCNGSRQRCGKSTTAETSSSQRFGRSWVPRRLPTNVLAGHGARPGPPRGDRGVGGGRGARVGQLPVPFSGHRLARWAVRGGRLRDVMQLDSTSRRRRSRGRVPGPGGGR
jgi:hypothetical protein